MKLGRLNHIGVATPSIADTSFVIASVAKQSSFGERRPRLLRRFTPRNDGWGL